MKNRVLQRVLLLVAALLLGACGGGGGGGGSSSVAFTGKTDQAAVTSANAKELSVNAYQGGMSGSALGVLGKEASGDASTSASRWMSLAATLEEAVTQATSASVSKVAKTVAVTAQDTISGPYGGTASYSIDVNENSGAFSGTLSFNAFKGLQDSSVTGSVGFSGTYNSSSGSFSAIKIGFSALAISEGGASYTASGDISLSQSATTKNVSISLVLKDGVTGKTYWVRDYSCILTTGSPQTITITGTYYDHDNGYVNITTPTPLRTSSASTLPTSGTFLSSGANGSKARLTFISGGYSVEVDSQGTGSYTTVP